MRTRKVYIVAAKRTPNGSFGGSLSTLSAVELGQRAVVSALEAAGIDRADVDELLMGCVLQAGVGQAPARQVAKLTGLPDKVTATTINKVCASGMKAVSLAAQSILLGDADVIVAGGMENMSQVPYYTTGQRWGSKYGNQQLIDGLQRDGLSDAYSHEAMGAVAECCAVDYALDRAAQDAYAISSYQRSQQAWADGKFDQEVVPVTVSTRRGEQVLMQDEEYQQVNFEKIGSLRPAFGAKGTITAANASTISDGAAALLLMSEEKMLSLGLEPLAEIVGYADAEQAPEQFTTTPALAANKALLKAGLSLADIDFFEFNEAFAVVALANAKILDLPSEKLNVYGGAIALGHPLGCSGARILVTLCSILQQESGRYGLASICNGGGGASAMILKKS